MYWSMPCFDITSILSPGFIFASSRSFSGITTWYFFDTFTVSIDARIVQRHNGPGAGFLFRPKRFASPSAIFHSRLALAGPGSHTAKTYRKDHRGGGERNSGTRR